MNFLVSGASGLIGSSLTRFLEAEDHSVKRLSRSRTNDSENTIHWDPESEALNKDDMDGFDAVIHLAGENIAGRWTEEKKTRIHDSRIKGTRLLRNRLSEVEHPPKVLVCASAIGYYGDRGDQVLTEESQAGSGFLPGLCREWEATTLSATQKGIRVVNMRIGVVLSAEGGALEKMLTPFKMGVGGIIGDGSQYWSWIALDDVVGAIHHAVVTDSLEGPVNAVAPNPVTNREFTKTLGRVLGRPTIFPMPGFAARLAFGEMANELLLSSTRVEPAKLAEAGYSFQFPKLDGALRHLLGRN